MRDPRSILGMLATFVLLAVAAVAGQACLVDSKCASDDDCPYPQHCGADGECFLECSASQLDSCPDERPECLVAEHRCVECLDADDCVGDEQCTNYSCQPAVAPDFTLVDANPTSPTLGREYTLSDQTGQLVVVFFAGLG